MHYELEGLWVENRLDVAFRFGDPVKVKTGNRIGETGRIVSLFSLDPFPYYVIEFPDGTSINAIESEIEEAQ